MELPHVVQNRSLPFSNGRSRALNDSDGFPNGSWVCRIEKKKGYGLYIGIIFRTYKKNWALLESVDILKRKVLP